MVACFDDNKQNFLLAFSVVGIENEASYIRYFRRFKEAYIYVDGLTFIIDRRKRLERAIVKIYLSVYHKNCMYHLSYK